MRGLLIFCFAACLSYLQAPGKCQEMRDLPECPQFSCGNGNGKGDIDCWRRVRSHAEAGRRLCQAGHVQDGLNCFTNAANAVQDEKLLPNPQQLGRYERDTLSFLYRTAASSLLEAGMKHKQAQPWLRRAAHISAPSVGVLFEEEGDPEPQGPGKKPASSASSLYPCDGESLALGGRWGEAATCWSQVASLELGYGGRSAASRALHLMGVSLHRFGDAVNSARAMKAAFRLSEKTR